MQKRFFRTSCRFRWTVQTRWKDDYPDSWEVEDHLPQHIIAEFEERQRQRLLSTMHTVTDAQKSSSSRSRAPRDKHSAGRREPAAQAA